MVWRILLTLSLLIAHFGVIAESADDYFHAGVQDYIFGEKQKATKEINTGLQIYPTDSKLNEAWKLLQKKEQQDQQKKDKQDQKDQQGQKDQKDDQQKSQQADKKKQDEDKAKQQQAKKDGDKDKDKQQQQKQAGKSDKDDEKPGDEEQATAAEAAMSPREARQLLESQQDQEKVLIFSPENQTAKPQPGKFKDW